MACTRSILFTITLLLCSSSAAPTAAASEPSTPTPPASEASAGAPSVEAPQALAEPAAVGLAEDPIPLAVHLYAAGDHQGLRSYTLAEAFEGGHSPTVEGELRYMAALATLELGEPRAAYQEFMALSEQTSGSRVAVMSELVLSSSWMEWAPQETARRAEAWMQAHPDDPLRPIAVRQASFAYATSGRYSTALSVLDGEGVPISTELRETLLASPRWKRPVLAAALSGALPGAGQLYAGQPREALSAFTVNALFISGAVLAARQQAWPALGLVGFFGLGFYTGNIYGAADGAIRSNRAQRDEVLDAMTGELGEADAPPLPQR